MNVGGSGGGRGDHVVDSEAETALKLVQYQNRALRDRLRSTAAENERLHEMLKQYRAQHMDGVSRQVTGVRASAASTQPVQVEGNGVVLVNQLPKDDAEQTIPALKTTKSPKMNTPHEDDDGAKERVFQLQERIATYEKEMERQRASIRQLEMQLENNMTSYEKDAQYLKEEYERRVQALEKELEDVKGTDIGRPLESASHIEGEDHVTSDDTVERLKNELDSVMVEKESALSRAHLLQASLDEAGRLQEDLQEEKKQLEAILVDKDERIQRMELDLEDIKCQANLDLEHVREESEWLKHGAEELQLQLDAAQRRDSVTQSTLISYQKKIQELEDALKTIQSHSEKESLQSAVVEAEPCIKCVEYDELVKARDTAIQEASKAIQRAIGSETALGELKREFESYKSERDEELKMHEQRYMSRYEDMKLQLCDSHKEIEQGTRQLELIKKEHNNELEKFKNSNRELQTTLQQERSQFETYRQTCEEKIAHVEREYKERSIEVDTLKNMVEVLKRKEVLKKKEMQEEPTTSVAMEQDVSQVPDTTNLPSSDTRPTIVMKKEPEEIVPDLPLSAHEVRGLKAMDSNKISEASPPDSLPGSILHKSQDALIKELQEQIRLLQISLDDSERTHELRDTSFQVLKNELAEIKRSEQRASIDIDYLKAVMVESFACGELDAKSPIFAVMSRLLKFSPEDIEKVEKAAKERDEYTLMNTASTVFTTWTDKLSDIVTYK